MPSEQVPFRTSLKLTPEQETRLLHHVVQKLEDCCKEMGRDKQGRTEDKSWLGIRRRNQLSFEGDFSWRVSELGGVFEDSNFSLGDGKRYVRSLAAKVTDDLIGTSPFFAAISRREQGKEQQAVVRAVEDYVQAEVEASPLPYILREAVELALARNEAVVKLRNIFDATGFVGPATVLVDEAGEPIRTPGALDAEGSPLAMPGKDLLIYENDDMVPVPPTEEEAALGIAEMFALEKDASFRVSAEERGSMRFARIEELPQTQVESDGLDASVLDPRDFICPQKCDDIHKADIVAHFYDESDTSLAATYRGFDVSAGYFTGTESGANAAIASQGEEQGATSGQILKYVPVGEVYVRFDADEDGQDEHILLVLDRGRGKAVFYDYLHNHMKKRPFEVIHGLRKVPGRWYGIGVFSDKHDQLIYIDKTFNRINLKNGKTASVTVAERDSIAEWKGSDRPITVGGEEILSWSKVWTESGERPPPIVRYNLIEVSDAEVNTMNTMRQASDMEFGVISAADAGALRMNPSETAHGLESIERSGNSIVKAVERVQMRGITALMEQAVDIVLETMDSTALVLSKEQALLTLNREEIRGLPRDVKLLLTRSRGSEGLAADEQATVIANEFFMLYETNPRRARALRTLYIRRLKKLEIEDSDDLLPEVTEEEVAAWMQAQQGGPPAEKEDVLKVSTKLETLAPSERAQVLQADGITPAPPEEVLAMQMDEAARKKAENAQRSTPNAQRSTEKAA